MADDRSRNRPGQDDRLDESDIADERMGRNSLQGNDQENVRNQRHALPDEKQEPDGVKASFQKLDKDVRAREDLGKGNRSGRSTS